jgi:phospholipase A-2-activating protein
VFDVDIQDGVPPLKLPYNTTGTYCEELNFFYKCTLTLSTENPFTAAQNFLQRNDLPLTYIDQVVKFIEQNTSGVTLGANSEYVDPWTGAFTRYCAKLITP